LSLWQLQILHDVLHGCFHVGKKRQDQLLLLGSLPSVFGYYLYLKFGHLTHHKSLGAEETASLATLFDSPRTDFEDGDVLFVAHRMEIGPDVGPNFVLPNGRSVTFSLSRSAFSLWKAGNPLWNGIVFAASFMTERIMLCINDVVVAVTGTNYFFPNKPPQFHQQCARQARAAAAFRLALVAAATSTAGGTVAAAWWKPLLFLLLSETLWSIPPHPCSAMFLTNHPSGESGEGSCVPSQSTYAGRWYSLLTLGTNYHVEHHDFPTVPFHLLHNLHQVAPDFYPTSAPQAKRSGVWTLMRTALSRPSVYACLHQNIASPAPSLPPP
jgi:fatty acid desaturase